jgi:pimeloyl-ACP methyl ester carboxylesterase
MLSAETVERLFTASAELGEWPQAKLHTQWPGSGRRGDPTFDAFYASQVESLSSSEDAELAMQRAGEALLERIGPAVLVTHSQGGYFGWLAADRRPDCVKAIVAVEPAGPPCEHQIFSSGRARAYGLTSIPLTFDPPLTSPDELLLTRRPSADVDLLPCWEQRGPHRRLPRLGHIPTVVVVGEASYHATFAHCVANWLRQAGVPAQIVRLEEAGIPGNGHMMMLEKNNLEIADLIDRKIRCLLERA